MGLLDRASILWGVAVAVVLAIISAVVAPLLGLEPASTLVGLVVGLVAAGGFLIVRVLLRIWSTGLVLVWSVGLEPFKIVDGLG